MKLVVDRERFAHAFSLVSSVVPSREAREVLHHVKVVATKQELLLQATDMEIGIRCRLTDVEIEKPGEVLLPTRRVKMILQESRDETMTLEQTSDGLILRGARSVFSLPTPATEEFPDVESFNPKSASYGINAQSLKKLIQHVIFAPDAENTRYSALAGVLFDIDDEDMLHIVATCGRRLAYETYQGKWHHKPKEAKELKEEKDKAPKEKDKAHDGDESSSKGNATVVTPKALQLLERTIDGSDEEALMTFSESRAIFKIGQVEIVTRLLDGHFPKWRRVIPAREGRDQVDLVVESFHSTLRQAAIVATEATPGVQFEFSNGKLVLSAQGAETGKSQVELPISATPSDPSKLHFKVDPKFLQQFLRVLGPDEVVSLFAAGDNDPLLLCFGETYQYVVMPLLR